MQGGYKVVTLCGSTRFKNEFINTQKRLTLEGNIVISVGLFGHSGDSEVWENMDEGTQTATKAMLDDMHKRKIDMADEIFVINVGGYIGESTQSEIDYAMRHGKTIRYLEETDMCWIPDICLDSVFVRLIRREKDIRRYTEIMAKAESPEDCEFRRRYCGFYRVRRNEEWRAAYFRLMASFKERGNYSFGEILLRLYQASGQIEASFSSKMLATLDPGMPIWDSNVLKCLNLSLKGSNPELRLSNAVVLYDRICRWYKLFLQTEYAAEMLKRFDEELPEFKGISDTKKIDFILWASQAQ